jgi:hypothetical protein
MAMKTTQAWGWLAAGVLALGLNGFYQDGGAAWAHRIADRVSSTVADRSANLLADASDRANGLFERASLLAARDQNASCRLARSKARFERRFADTEVAQFEALSARQEAQLARFEARRTRMEAQLAQVRVAHVAFEIPHIQVACPRVRVNVPHVSVPRVNIQAPMVKVKMSGDGPI